MLFVSKQKNLGASRCVFQKKISHIAESWEYFPRYSLLLPSFHSAFLCKQAKCLISGSSEPRTMPDHMKAFKEGKDGSMGMPKNPCWLGAVESS